MNRRQKLKKKKRDYVAFAYKIDIAKEMREDSIAHLVKSYFTVGTLHNNELFKYDNVTGKLLVSEKALNYLIKLCDSSLLEKDYDFKLVPELRIFSNEENNNDY